MVRKGVGGRELVAVDGWLFNITDGNGGNLHLT